MSDFAIYRYHSASTEFRTEDRSRKNPCSSKLVSRDYFCLFTNLVNYSLLLEHYDMELIPGSLIKIYEENCYQMDYVF